MHHKNLILILAAALTVSACGDWGFGEAYEFASLNRLTVQAVYPEGLALRSGAKVTVADIAEGSTYTLTTDGGGRAWTQLPNGVYRISVRDHEGEDILNATRDKVIVSGGDLEVSLQLKRSKPGKVVIKEIYNGGCLKLPKEGDYQSDQYILLHNNSVDPYYLDGLCMGYVAPYNSQGNNNWVAADGTLPDFIPVLDAVLMMPGAGNDFPLQPGEDAIVCLRGAIDHTLEYPLSVNLNRPDVFVCYDPVYFDKAEYHPTPGDKVDPKRYLEIVIKVGQSKATALSVTSPAFILFRAPDGTDIHTWVQDNIRQAKSEKAVAVPPDWVIDGVDVFTGLSTSNKKRLPDTIDAGFVTLSVNKKGHTLMRKVDPDADLGFEFLQDTNNSTEDFYERETQSLHED